MMAAGVAGELAGHRLSIRDGVLRDARQRVVLRQDADHRLAPTRAGDECGRDAGDAGLDLEPALVSSCWSSAELFVSW